MKNRILFTLWIIACGCIDDMPINLPKHEPRLIIDALISSEAGESQIIIGWTSPVGHDCRDSFGNVINCVPAGQSAPFKVMGQLTISEEGSSNVFATSFNMSDKKGLIQINPNFTGLPGNKYFLNVDITYEGTTETFLAETAMLETPVIEGITYEIRKGDVGKSDNFVPLISFTEPAEKNYYLFQLCQATRGSSNTFCGNDRVWSYSLISDTFLPDQVEGLSIDDGASIAKYAEFYPPPQPNYGAEVKMFSVNSTTYYFYKALIDQFNNDGGAFSPTPATPEGNISGGALGLFRALNKSSATAFY